MKVAHVEQTCSIKGAARRRADRQGVHVVSLLREGCDEHFITASRLEGESPAAVFQRAAAALGACGGSVVSMELAGMPAADPSITDALVRAFGPVHWPVTWIDRHADGGPGGVHLWAVAGPSPVLAAEGGQVTSVHFEDPWASWCRTGGFVPADAGAPPAQQTSSVFRQMEAALEAAGMSFSEVVRTWFYNRDITAWYGDFNAARSSFFEARGVFDGCVPASTGVGGGTSCAAALTGSLLALRPKADAGACIEAVVSPLQCPATSYGSAFSRAIELRFPDHVRLLVSGTASIAPEGETEHTDDFEAQVRRTFDVVDALLESRGLGWDDVSNGLAYVKRREDFSAFAQFLERRQLDRLPLLTVHADICRDDLLFELELQAVSPRSFPSKR